MAMNNTRVTETSEKHVETPQRNNEKCVINLLKKTHVLVNECKTGFGMGIHRNGVMFQTMKPLPSDNIRC